MQYASGGNNMAQNFLCTCAGFYQVCFPVGYACTCICIISLSASKRMLFPFKYQCQAAFNTWISRSSPHAHLLLHTLLISIPWRERGYTAANVPKTAYRLIQCRATVTEPWQCFTTSNNSLILCLRVCSCIIHTLSWITLLFMLYNVQWQHRLNSWGLDFST